MGFLKGFGVSVLSFLLFLSLSVFSLAFLLNQSVLKPDFVVSQLNKLDVSAMADEFISEQVAAGGELTTEGEELVAEVITDTVADLEPWMKEQAGILTNSIYDYILGESESLSVSISLGTMKDSLKDNLKEAILQSPPPELAGIPPAQFDQYFDEFFQQYSGDIPDTFNFDENSFPAGAQTIIEQVRQAIPQFRIVFWGLIGFMLLLILGIVLIGGKVKSSTRSLGITFFIYGALEYAGVYLSNTFLGPQLAATDMPTVLATWIPQFVSDFLAPLQMFGIGLMAAGVVLIVVSIIYRQEARV